MYCKRVNPKMDMDVPPQSRAHNVTRAMGAGAKKMSKTYPYGCKILKK